MNTVRCQQRRQIGRGAAIRCADIQGIREGSQRYGLLLNDAGGIKDDFMTTRLAGEDALYLVVNAAMKEAGLA